LVPALVEHADVEGVAGVPGRRRGPVVAVADGDLPDARRHVHRQVDPVRYAGLEASADGAGLLVLRGVGEAQRVEGDRGASDAGGGHHLQEPATVDVLA
jgi:hypothetical protein